MRINAAKRATLTSSAMPVNQRSQTGSENHHSPTTRRNCLRSVTISTALARSEPGTSRRVKPNRLTTSNWGGVRSPISPSRSMKPVPRKIHRNKNVATNKESRRPHRNLAKRYARRVTKAVDKAHARADTSIRGKPRSTFLEVRN